MQIALECAEQQLETLKKDVEMLSSRAKLMESLEGQLKHCIKEKQAIDSQLQDAVAKNSAKNSATDAALVMIGAFRDVCTSCRSCKRKCVGKGLMDD